MPWAWRCRSGIAEAYARSVTDPLGDLVARYARTHGPFPAATCASRFGLGVFVVEQALRRLAASGRLTSGEFTPGGAGLEYCDVEVLRTLRRRSLAALRKEIEPVTPQTLARFLPAWQHVGSAARGVAAVASAIELLQGVALPASSIEKLVLPARVADYSPAFLDEMCASGEVIWSGSGAIGGADGWIHLAYADGAPLLLPPANADLAGGPVHDAILETLAGGQALFFRQLADRLPEVPTADVAAAIWDLVWAGYLSNDTIAPLRALLAGGTGAHRAPAAPGRSRYRRLGRPAVAAHRRAFGRSAVDGRTVVPAARSGHRPDPPYGRHCGLAARAARCRHPRRGRGRGDSGRLRRRVPGAQRA